MQKQNWLYDDIIAGIRKGGIDKKMAESALFEKYKQDFSVYGQFKFQALSEPELQSAFNDTIIAAIKNIEEDKFKENSSFKTYLTSIFFKKCIDSVRKRFSAVDKLFVDTTNELEGSEENSPNELLLIEDTNVRNKLDLLINREENRLLYARLFDLGETCRRMLWLWARGYKNSEIVEIITNYSSEKAVASKLSECMNKLRNLYKKR